VSKTKVGEEENLLRAKQGGFVAGSTVASDGSCQLPEKGSGAF